MSKTAPSSTSAFSRSLTKLQILHRAGSSVRFICEEMKVELLLCDEAWELENGPGSHLLLIDRCPKNQVRKRNKEVEAESDRLLLHRW